MTIPHPIPYQGSKRQLAPVIAGYFPPAQRLIEPFAGSAAVSLYAAYHRKVNHIVLNDINGPLMSLWHSIIRHPRQLADQYGQLWQMQQGRERRFYDLVRTRFNRTHQPYYLLYLLARCVKASIRYNANGEFNQSPDNRRLGRSPITMTKDILAAAALLQNARLISEDYRAVLETATPDDIVYLDPPYQGVCANRDPRYLAGVSVSGFVEALEGLNRRKIPYIVSYDGRTGTKHYGSPLPDHLDLQRIEIEAGRSSQATLLGRSAVTYESLYLSPALQARLEPTVHVQQPLLWQEPS